VTATLRMIVSEGFFKVRIPDVLLKRYLFLIGGYSEMLFSENMGKPVCVCRSSEIRKKKKRIRKRTKCHTYLQHGCIFGKSNIGEEFL